MTATTLDPNTHGVGILCLNKFEAWNFDFWTLKSIVDAGQILVKVHV